eukprot:12653901-Alexandrium_andersonii.AAC.1
MSASLVGSEMCIRDRHPRRPCQPGSPGAQPHGPLPAARRQRGARRTGCEAPCRSAGGRPKQPAAATSTGGAGRPRPGLSAPGCAASGKH